MRNVRSRARSESEETSKASFDALLKTHYPASTVTWCDGEDPPDYYLEFDGELFAVEVSIILQPIQIGRARLRFRDIGHALEAFIQEVELSAREAEVLKGKYIVYMPRAIPDLRHAGLVLRERILEFLAATRASPAGVREEFSKVERRRCVIEKIDEGGSDLISGGPTDCRWGIDAERELSELVAERIKTKADILQPIRLPKILLLDEQYVFAEASMYSGITPPTGAVDEFHTIYVSRRGADGILLSSRFPGLRGVWDR